jgi:hypothetical protein
MSLQRAPVEQDVATALPAAQADVRSEAIKQPLLATTGVGSSQFHDIAEPELDDP